mgnify:CR=1 FL=1
MTSYIGSQKERISENDMQQKMIAIRQWQMVEKPLWMCSRSVPDMLHFEFVHYDDTLNSCQSVLHVVYYLQRTRNNSYME